MEKSTISAELEHEEIVLSQMRDELKTMLRVRGRNKDWLHCNDTTTKVKSEPRILELLSKLCQLQLNPEERLSELTFRISETRAENDMLLTSLEKKELTRQLEELKERRQSVAELLGSVKNANLELKFLMDKRSSHLIGDKDQNRKSCGSEDVRNTMEDYLMDKFEPVVFDEEKALRGLEKLRLLEEERVNQTKRLSTITGKSALPSIPIPETQFIASQKFNERKAYLEGLIQKIQSKSYSNF